MTHIPRKVDRDSPVIIIVIYCASIVFLGLLTAIILDSSIILLFHFLFLFLFFPGVTKKSIPYQNHRGIPTLFLTLHLSYQTKWDKSPLKSG